MNILDKALRTIDADFSISDFVESVKRYGKELKTIKTEKELINKQSEAAKYINDMNDAWKKQRKKMQEEIYRIDSDISTAIKNYKMDVSKAQHNVYDKKK